MRALLLVVILLWACGLVAGPKGRSATPSPKELSQEARLLSSQAALETDPTKADLLRKRACETWETVVQQSQRPEDQLSLGLCYGARKEYAEAEAAFRSFLLLAPATHPDRALAEQSLAYVLEAKQTQAAQLPTEFVMKDPIPIEESAQQWKRKALFAGGTLGGLGLVAGVLAKVLLHSQQPPISQGTSIVKEVP